MATQPTILEFAAHGVSWVEVFDAVGQSKLRKLTVDGDVLRVSGQLPLSVVVGRADQITVIVRGKPLDITALAKDNVARFEVK
jgi:cytoskeleton protein RodZ